MKSIDGVVPPTKRPVKKTAAFRKHWLQLLVLAAVLVICAAALVFSRQNVEGDQVLGSDVSSVKAAVGKHYILPADEEPALATVTDKSKVTSTIGKKAENGDRVLIYQKNRQAIVYRPTTDRIVDVVPVTIDDVPQTEQ